MLPNSELHFGNTLEETIFHSWHFLQQKLLHIPASLRFTLRRWHCSYHVVINTPMVTGWITLTKAKSPSFFKGNSYTVYSAFQQVLPSHTLLWTALAHLILESLCCLQHPKPQQWMPSFLTPCLNRKLCQWRARTVSGPLFIPEPSLGTVWDPSFGRQPCLEPQPTATRDDFHIIFLNECSP